jgi:zinc transporter 2
VSASDSSNNHQQTLAMAARLMREKYGVHECTVQIEEYVDEMDDCTQCQDPKD